MNRRIPVWLAITAASLPLFMATLDNLVVTNALPVIHEKLGASVEELQWIVNAYALAFATFMMLAVGLGDRFGRRRVFIAGIAIFTLASAAAALSTDPTQLITARAFQGIGSASVMPLSLTLQVNHSRSWSRICHCGAMVTRPCSVNFSALPTRLTSICRMRVGSPKTCRSCMSSGITNCKCNPRWSALCWKAWAQLLTSSGKLKAMCSSSCVER